MTAFKKGARVVVQSGEYRNEYGKVSTGENNGGLLILNYLIILDNSVEREFMTFDF